MEMGILEQGVQDVRNKLIRMVEDVEQKIEQAAAERVKRSEVQTERDRVDKRLGGVEESLKAITARLESLERHVAEQDKNIQRLSGRCDANAQGSSLVQTLPGGVEKGTNAASTRAESFVREVDGCRGRWQGCLFRL